MTEKQFEKEYKNKYIARCPLKHMKSGKMSLCYANVNDCKQCWHDHLVDGKE